MYGAEGWTLKTEKSGFQSSRHVVQPHTIEYKLEKKIDIISELEKERELYGIIVNRKVTYFDHILCRYTNSSITKIIVKGKVEGKRRRGRTKISYRQSQLSKPTPSWVMLPKSKTVKVSYFFRKCIFSIKCSISLCTVSLCVLITIITSMLLFTLL